MNRQRLMIEGVIPLSFLAIELIMVHFQIRLNGFLPSSPNHFKHFIGPHIGTSGYLKNGHASIAIFCRKSNIIHIKKKVLLKFDDYR